MVSNIDGHKTGACSGDSQVDGVNEVSRVVPPEQQSGDGDVGSCVDDDVLRVVQSGLAEELECTFGCTAPEFANPVCGEKLSVV